MRRTKGVLMMEIRVNLERNLQMRRVKQNIFDDQDKINSDRKRRKDTGDDKREK